MTDISAFEMHILCLCARTIPNNPDLDWNSTRVLNALRRLWRDGYMFICLKPGDLGRIAFSHVITPKGWEALSEK